MSNDASARVPLIIVDPRREGGRTVRQTVRSIDVMPSLLDLIAHEIPSSVNGRSLLPYLDGEETDLGLEAFHETGFWLTRVPGMPPDHLEYPNILELLDIKDKTTGTLSVKADFKDIVIEAKDRMVRTDRWKLTYQPLKNKAVFNLFDLNEDPDCEHDVIDVYPEAAQSMKDRLIEWILEDPTMISENGRIVARGPVKQTEVRASSASGEESEWRKGIEDTETMPAKQ